MADPISIPVTRVARILSLLELHPPEDEVVDIYLTADGGMVTCYKHDERGNRVDDETEIREVVYTSDPDLRYSSRRAQES